MKGCCSFKGAEKRFEANTVQFVLNSQLSQRMFLPSAHSVLTVMNNVTEQYLIVVFVGTKVNRTYSHKKRFHHCLKGTASNHLAITLIRYLQFLVRLNAR